MSGNESVMRHKGATEELNALYERKNHDYGDSFHLTWEKFGAVMAAIRLEDKLQRFETLIRSESKVRDESIRDTLMDLANYSIMAVMELDREAEARRMDVEEGVTTGTVEKTWFAETVDSAVQGVEDLSATFDGFDEFFRVCKTCQHHREINGTNPSGSVNVVYRCYGQPDAPEVSPTGTCEGWKRQDRG